MVCFFIITFHKCSYIMSAFIYKNKPLESIKIDKENISEMKFWSNELKCDIEELIAAIQEVGNSIWAIRYYFRIVQAD